MALTLDQANRIIAAALARSRELGLKPMGVVGDVCFLVRP